MTKTRDEDPPQFKMFAKQMAEQLLSFKGDLTKREWGDEQTKLQNWQVPMLIALERSFLDALESSPGLAEKVFSEFQREACADPKPSSFVRGFTRERNLVFVRVLMPVVVRGAWQDLEQFAWNWPFLMYVWSHVVVSPARGAKLRGFCKKSWMASAREAIVVSEATLDRMEAATCRLANLRDNLVVTNLQLVVDRAMAFFRCTPQTSQSTDMDSVLTATEGLMAGVDKVMLECRPMAGWADSWHPVKGFCYWRGQSSNQTMLVLPVFESSGYRAENHHTAAKHVSKVVRVDCPANTFRTTAIGRMGARLIQAYSQTHMHLGPDDKRLLYQVNRVASKRSESGTPDYDGMASDVLRDRVSWTLAQRSGLDAGELASAIDEGLEEGDWEEAREALIKAGGGVLSPEIVDLTVVKASKKAPTGDQVAGIMQANAVASMVDEDGEDRMEEAAACAAPLDGRPDVQLYAKSRVLVARRALEYLSMIERKFLILLGLAPLDCIHYPYRRYV